MPTDTRRTARITIITPVGEPYRFLINRETRRVYDDGASVLVDEGRVARELPDLAGQTLPGGPVTVTTYTDLQAVISACCAALEAEDIAQREAEAAERAAREETP